MRPSRLEIYDLTNRIFEGSFVKEPLPIASFVGQYPVVELCV